MQPEAAAVVVITKLFNRCGRFANSVSEALHDTLTKISVKKKTKQLFPSVKSAGKKETQKNLLKINVDKYYTQSQK